MQHNDPSGGFISALFDISFGKFVTTQLISILYILLLIIIGLGLLVAWGSGLVQLFKGEFLSALFTIIFAPLVAIIAVVIARVYLELIIVIFKIAENTRNMVDNQQKVLQKDS